MHRTTSLAVALALCLAACSGEDDDETTCTFSGSYALGAIALDDSPLCPDFSITIPGDGRPGPCFTTARDVTPDGVVWEVSLFCEPAEPVGECTGLRTDSNGCRQEVYLRRLAR